MNSPAVNTVVLEVVLLMEKAEASVHLGVMPVFIELNVVLQLKVLVPKLMMLFNESDTKFNTDKLDHVRFWLRIKSPPMVAVVDVLMVTWP